MILGQRDGIPVKPDPTAAMEIGRDLDVSPARILYVGDTNTDMQTAVNAGMFPVGALWGFRDEEELRTAGAQQIVSRPQELLNLL